MADGLVVLKFGGTSVADASAFTRVAEIVATCAQPRVVVVSAMSGVTDSLLAACRDAAAGREADATAELSSVLARHRDVAASLLPHEIAARLTESLTIAEEEILTLFRRLVEDPPQRAAVTDEVVANGERLCAAILAEFLSARGVPARRLDPRACIVTDEQHGRATPLADETTRLTRLELVPLLAAGQVPVLDGHIGRTQGGATTTLGRGGSDYTAALVGAALDAGEIQVWTDVPGVLTADPRIVAAARVIPVLSYAEAAELAYFGAKVLHPKTMWPARDRGIPIRILSTLAPDKSGTLVSDEAHVWPGNVKSIAHRGGVTVVQVAPGRKPGVLGFFPAVFDLLDRYRIEVDVVATSEVSVSLAVEETGSLAPVLEELRRLGRVRVERQRAVVCVVGEGLRTTPGIAGRIFETIPDVHVSLISQGASQVNLSFVVDEAQVRDAVTRLHASLIENGKAATEPLARTATRRIHHQLDVVHLTRDLIDIPSLSGDEAEIADFVGRFLEELGYRTETFEAAPRRPNVLAYAGSAPRIVFCTHLDTVPPHLPSHEDRDWVFGRGACDAKGIAAAQIMAAERLRAAGVDGIGLLFVVDEELASLGARSANAHPRARDCRFAIVGEPTDGRLAVGSRGSLQLRLRAAGPGGHAGLGDPGDSAIHDLLDAIAALRACRWPSDPYFGATTLNVGTIGGGTRPNVLAADAYADVQIRLATPAAPVKAIIEEALGTGVSIEYGSITPPMRFPAAQGFETCVVGYTTDVPHLSNWGTGLLLGPGSIGYAHSPEERIGKTDLLRGIDLYTQLVETLLTSPPKILPTSAAIAERS